MVERAEGRGDDVAAIVGVGASAGGLAALRTLFAEVTPCGVAWVVILHRLDTAKSELADILQRGCAVPVRSVQSRTRLEPDNVYVVPGQRVAEVQGDELVIRGPQTEVERHFPIDVLFRSLARADVGTTAGVVLSGTSSDGAIGLQEIEAVGGGAFVQQQDTAAHPDMPRAAAAITVALALPPERIAHAVVQLTRRGPEAFETRISDSQIERVLALMASRARFDFGPYRRATLRRRLLRRMALAHTEDPARYIELIESDSLELERLLADLLIHVTTFFREPDAWDVLRAKVLDPLIALGDPLRMWAVGCSTGEEAYTLAISVCEAMDAAGRELPVQIFATDVSKPAIEVARRGVYPPSIAEQLDPARLERFFEPTGIAYRVSSRLREMIVFAPQNVLGDPPFSRLDLITCRNLLIYLEKDTQRRVLDTLRYALRPGGFLFLGSAEMIPRGSEDFRSVGPEQRIYQRSDAEASPPRPRPVPTASPRYSPDAAPSQAHGDVAGLTQRHLLARYAPAAVTVDEQMRTVYFHGPTHRYLRQPEGEPTRNLLDLVGSELRGPLRSLVRDALQSGMAETELQARTEDDTVARLRLSAHRFIGAGVLGEAVVVVTIDPQPLPAAVEPTVDPDAPAHELVRQLESDLARTRDDLERTIGELERANHELTSSNEEVMSMNEELQSTNEELQTSKEELVSVNEELVTVNDTLEEKVEELERTTDDLGNLLRSSDLPTLFLDEELRIRRFTPAARRVLRAIASDVGRSVGDLSGTVDVRTIEEDARRVLAEHEMVTGEETSSDGKTYVRRVLPYRTTDDRVEGVVITYSDVTDLKRAEARLERQSLEARLVLRATTLVAESESFEESLGGCLAVACELMGWPVGHIWLPRDDGPRPTGIWVLDDPESRRALTDITVRTEFSPGKGLPGRIVASGEPILIPDVLEDRSFWRAHQGVDIGVRSVLGFPIPLGHEVVAVIEMFKDEPAERDDKLLELLRAVGTQIGRAVERKRAEEALRTSEARLREQARRLEESARHTNEFLALLGHELRNPLAPIRHSVTLLRGDVERLPSELRPLVEVVDRQSLQMSRLVDDLLDVARITRGTISLSLSLVDLRNVISEAVETVAGAAEEREHAIAVEAPDDPVVVRGDAARLVQVVANLMANAVKYTDPGGSIWLKLSVDGHEAVVRVRDTGIGIEPDRIAEVFQAFKQFGQTIDRARGGLGLGLTLVQSLVDAHGGRVFARSEGEGRGSEFEVRLPLDRARDAVEAADPRDGATPATRPLDVLVCDDNEDAAATLALLLRRRGHRVSTAHTGAAAIRLVRETKPDVAFLDIGLPDMDGYEVARALRGAAGRPMLVAVTGYGQERDRALAAEAGFDHHLLKPVSSSTLEELLRTAAARHLERS